MNKEFIIAAETYFNAVDTLGSMNMFSDEFTETVISAFIHHQGACDVYGATSREAGATEVNKLLAITYTKKLKQLINEGSVDESEIIKIQQSFVDSFKWEIEDLDSKAELKIISERALARNRNFTNAHIHYAFAINYKKIENQCKNLIGRLNNDSEGNSFYSFLGACIIQVKEILADIIHYNSTIISRNTKEIDDQSLEIMYHSIFWANLTAVMNGDDPGPRDCGPEGYIYDLVNVIIGPIDLYNEDWYSDLLKEYRSKKNERNVIAAALFLKIYELLKFEPSNEEKVKGYTRLCQLFDA